MTTTKNAEMSCIGCGTRTACETTVLVIENQQTTWLKAPKSWWVMPMLTPVPGAAEGKQAFGVAMIAACEVCMRLGRFKSNGDPTAVAPVPEVE